MATRLSETEKSNALSQLTDWKTVEDRDAITKTFSFRDFNEAFAFMTRIAMVAEKMDHHPEWFNVYNRVEVTLTTHDAGGVSQLDVNMAIIMNTIAAG